MLLKNEHHQISCYRCCPECIVTRSSHCAHCPAYRNTVAPQVPDGYDYSHLVDGPVKQRDMVFDAAQFDGLLTDYDRILLGFGMHIS